MPYSRARREGAADEELPALPPTARILDNRKATSVGAVAADCSERGVVEAEGCEDGVLRRGQDDAGDDEAGQKGIKFPPLVEERQDCDKEAAAQSGCENRDVHESHPAPPPF